MKHKLFLLASTLTLGCLPASAQITINFGTPALEVGLQSNGTSALTGFNFVLGSFASFVPTTSNLGSWSGNFTAAGLSTAWFDFIVAPQGQFTGAVTLTNATPASLLNSNAYVWGFRDSQSLSVTADEWVLIDLNLLFPSSIPGTPTPGPTYTINPINGSAAILGTLNSTSVGSSTYIQTAAVAVPEPSTYAALMAAGVLGFVAFRRFRRQPVQAVA